MEENRASSNKSWAQFPAAYRAREMRVVARWITAGESGTVAGLPGTGRSTFLGFLCHRPDALRPYLPETQVVVLLPVDLNNLPDRRLVTLYRVILRAFYENQARFERPVQRQIRDLYQANRAVQDAFLAQSALRQLLLYLQEQRTRVVLVFNRFDRFCRYATPQMTWTLRGLRDSFKETLTYIVGMRQEVMYYSNYPALDPLYFVLDAHVCWVRPLTEPDAQNMIERRMGQLAEDRPSQAAVRRILELSGGFPSLVRLVCQLLLASPPKGNLLQALTSAHFIQERGIQRRLSEVWEWLTAEEQQFLPEAQKWQVVEKTSGRPRSTEQNQRLASEHQQLLQQLARKGICRVENGRWTLAGELLAAYVAQMSGVSRGRVWLDAQQDVIYQGPAEVTNLQPLEQAVLRFFTEYPYTRHTHTAIIEAAWPADTLRDGVSSEALYQVIRGVRKKIEPDAARPRYVVTWRGKPEGGYQFYPEGRPG